jgi:nucleoid-associated protein YgaU
MAFNCDAVALEYGIEKKGNVMGFWNFWKGDDEAPKAEDLTKEVEELGLNTAGLSIAMDGDVVKVSGQAVDQETKEKIIMAVGNSKGVAAVDDSASGADPVFHEVQKGDTLWAISAAALGNGARYEEIFEANKPMLSHPDKIYPGQRLRIPQDGSTSA